MKIKSANLILSCIRTLWKDKILIYYIKIKVLCVLFSHSVVSDSSRPRGL